jgi:hypothetical protein
MAKARAAGPLSPVLEISAKQVEALIDRLAGPSGAVGAAADSSAPHR